MMTEGMQAAAESPSGEPSARTVHGARAHVSSLRELAAVLAALLALTALTVAAARVDLGSWNLFIALGIASVKVLLVVLFFMHLRYDRPFHGIVFLAAILFVMLFVGLVLVDTSAYQSNLIPGYAPALEESEAPQQPAPAAQQPGSAPAPSQPPSGAQ